MIVQNVSIHYHASFPTVEAVRYLWRLLHIVPAQLDKRTVDKEFLLNWGGTATKTR